MEYERPWLRARRRIGRSTGERAFSLVELVIVIVIIGVLAAIAVPRLSRGATAAGESALAANLAAMRTAIELFYVEHNMTYPSLAKFEQLLTQSSDITGGKVGAKDVLDGIVLGPYLRAIPPLPVGANKGKTAVVATRGEAGGWVYHAPTGSISANCGASEVDSSGKRFNTY